MVSEGRDRLARLLHTLRMRGTFYCHAELGEPWALEMPAIPDSVSFHVVTGGVCWLRLPDTEPIELRAGDLALVPHGLGHDLLSEPVVSFDDAGAHELMRTLPAVLIITGDTVSVASSVRDTLRLMAGELVHPQLGGEAVATRLADILVVQAIRSWITSDEDAATGWLRALQDERIGRALEAIHADPGNDWSLDVLARVATMSRSSFSARFTELVGEAPIAYLTRWRMNIAASRLREENITAAKLASELGYQSEAAFNRAFTHIIGQTPGSVRSQRQ